MQIREYTEADLEQMIPIWNEIVEEGIAFPQEAVHILRQPLFFLSTHISPIPYPFMNFLLRFPTFPE